MNINNSGKLVLYCVKNDLNHGQKAMKSLLYFYICVLKVKGNVS